MSIPRCTSHVCLFLIPHRPFLPPFSKVVFSRVQKIIACSLRFCTLMLDIHNGYYLILEKTQYGQHTSCDQ